MFSRRPVPRMNRGRISSSVPYLGPVQLSAAVNAAGTLVTVTFDRALNGSSVPGTGDWSWTNADLLSVTNVAIVGSTVQLTVSPAIYQPDFNVRVAYVPGATPLQSATGVNCRAFSGLAVTNNSTTNLTAAQLNTGVAAAITTKTVLGFWEASLGLNQVNAAGRLSSWDPQTGAKLAWTSPGATNDPVINSSDSDFGGRASISFDGVNHRMTSATNPPNPSTTPEHRLTVCLLSQWTVNKTFGQAGDGRFGGRTSSKGAAYEQVGNLAVGTPIDFYEAKGTILEELLAGNSTSDLMKVGSGTSTQGVNYTTGVAIESQDPASTGLGANTAGTRLINGKYGCRLETTGPLSATEVTKVRAYYRAYYGTYAISERRMRRVSGLGASIMRNVGATNFDGYRKYVYDQARTAGYPLYFFGTTADGTQLDNGHSGISGSDIATCRTLWDNNYVATKQFAGWADIIWLSIGAADILNGTSGAVAAVAYESFIRYIISTQTQISQLWLMTEPPIDGTVSQNTEMAAFNAALPAIWTRVMADTGVRIIGADLYGAMGGVYNATYFVAGQNHPNDAGYALISPTIWTAVSPYLDSATTF